MGDRRMFSKSIIDSDSFLDMPATTQLLYFHLGMCGDDEGFINNPRKVQRSVGCTDDDMRLLIAKQFIIPFDSGVIVIRHWCIHNTIRKDRLKPTIFRAERHQLGLDENDCYYLPDSQSPTACQPPVNQLPTERPHNIREDNIREDNIREDNAREDGSHSCKPTKHKHGSFGHVLLTDEELSRLRADLGEPTVTEYIRRLDEYIEQKGAKYRNHSLTIRNWAKRDTERGQPKQPALQPEKTNEELYRVDFSKYK